MTALFGEQPTKLKDQTTNNQLKSQHKGQESAVISMNTPVNMT